MITVTLGVVCYSTPTSSHDERVVLVSLGVAEDPPPPPLTPSRDAPPRAPGAAALGESGEQALGALQGLQVAAGPSP